ncbi:MAG: glycosyltransferase family 2 protein [Phycisphaeraceae bacterium]|nr:glycosyltransferase family 2 protein [Phycisphaeraceae bacterium]
MLTTDLIIPARNEAPNIEVLLAQLPHDRLRHVVVVDNGSTDGTADLARSAGATVVHEPRPGYGGACLAGLAWIADQTPPDAVAFIDADLADDPAQLPRLLTLLTDDDADMVIGCRPQRAEPGALTPVQRFGNQLSCTLIRLATGRRFTDLGPLRAVRYDRLQELNMADRTWGWTVEMQFKAAARGMTVAEIDVPYRCRREGESKISGTISGSVRAGVKILTTIGCLWAAHLFGRLGKRRARDGCAARS